MIVVTGGLGFIGSNLIKKLNNKNISDIILVDNIDKNGNYENLKGLKFNDFYSSNDFLNNIENISDIKYIFHLGACSSTTEMNGDYLYNNNFLYSRKLIDYCSSKKIPITYASSASVYGLGYYGFDEETRIESPLNLYAASKFLIDNYVISNKFNCSVSGLRFFNVYGPGEKHKGEMKSVIGKFLDNIILNDKLQLFEGSENIYRDFIFIDDVCDICMFFLDNNFSGLYNVGTGNKNSFMEIYNIINSHLKKIKLENIPFPNVLKGKYQFNTIANIDKLRKIGYKNNFTTLKDGIINYSKTIKND